MKDKLRNTGCPEDVIAGYHRPQQQYSRCQLRLRLCAGGHAEAYGDGVTVGLKSQGRKARTFI